ncbi:MAG: LON peptidase substrate-binding domain-containing protein [Gammaproteobacteria bacterium]|nr:LON peptidase substrate-binding domain-containing protein [Gammaproteobacteria bacterium]
MASLPLFPLSTVILPDGLLPLRLFERRYLDMVKQCFQNDTGFGVCLIREGMEAGTPAQPYPMGTEVKIIDFDQGSDGLLHITTRGVREFQILTYAADESQLLIGEVEFLEVPPTPDMAPDTERLAGTLKTVLELLEQRIPISEWQMDNPAWIANRLIELLPLDAASKYELLELHSTEARLNQLATLQIEFVRNQRD